MKQIKTQNIVTKNTLILLCVIVVLPLAILVVYLIATDPSVKAPASLERNVTVSGTFVCLPHKDSGITTEECAFGLEGEDGKYYALGSSDSYFDYFQSGKEAKVTGVFKASQNSRYKDIGLITVESVQPIE